ncbi:LysR substrate-binding domain-containing protein [Embleya sp. NPDC059259]|uniref:LysR substrate-binding domain-containing protein n=1 Tax=unclassified Embleya TaxID=2699296 RepID=UPI0036A3251B
MAVPGGGSVRFGEDGDGDGLGVRGGSGSQEAAAPANDTALQFVRRPALVAAVPRIVGGPALDDPGLRGLPLPPPLTTPAVPIHLAWHQRYDNDPAHAWLRAEVRSAPHHACNPDDDAASGPAGGPIPD